jgi:hypothetical protein
LVKIPLLLIGQSSRPLLEFLEVSSHRQEEIENLTPVYLIIANPTLLVLSKTQTESQSTFKIGQLLHIGLVIFVKKVDNVSYYRQSKPINF